MVIWIPTCPLHHLFVCFYLYPFISTWNQRGVLFWESQTPHTITHNIVRRIVSNPVAPTPWLGLGHDSQWQSTFKYLNSVKIHSSSSSWSLWELQMSMTIIIVMAQREQAHALLILSPISNKVHAFRVTKKANLITRLQFDVDFMHNRVSECWASFFKNLDFWLRVDKFGV